MSKVKKKVRNYLRKRIQKNTRCRRCNAIVLRSDSEDYTYQCLFCDEDLYTFEVYTGNEVTADELDKLKLALRPLLRSA